MVFHHHSKVRVGKGELCSQARDVLEAVAKKQSNTASALSLHRVTQLPVPSSPSPEQSAQADTGKRAVVELLHLLHFKSKMVRKNQIF